MLIPEKTTVNVVMSNRFVNKDGEIIGCEFTVKLNTQTVPFKNRQKDPQE